MNKTIVIFIYLERKTLKHLVVYYIIIIIEIKMKKKSEKYTFKQPGVAKRNGTQFYCEN